MIKPTVSSSYPNPQSENELRIIQKSQKFNGIQTHLTVLGRKTVQAQHSHSDTHTLTHTPIIPRHTV